MEAIEEAIYFVQPNGISMIRWKPVQFQQALRESEDYRHHPRPVRDNNHR